MKLALLFLFIFATSAFARLGETIDECIARYGPGIRIGDPQSDSPIYQFEKYDIKIRVWFLGNRSVCETFARENGNLGDFFISDILTGNSQGSSWTPMKFGDSSIAYSRADGKAIAQYMAFPSLHNDVLLISTTDFDKAKNNHGF
jgi:hypothetical protein